MYLHTGLREVRLNLVRIKKALFGIAQGGLYKDLREESIKKLIKNRF